MSFQLGTNAPSGRFSRSLPRGPEAVIEFEPNDQNDALKLGINHSPAEGPCNIQPTDLTLIWYHSLGIAERQIKGLQLHETHKQSPFVVLSMKDDSFLSLKLSQHGNSVEVVRLTEITDLVPPSIQVQFTQGSQSDDSYVDLKFAIAVCHGVLNSKSLINPANARVMMPIPQCQQIFALALFLSIIRKRLPIDSSLIKDIQSLGCVDDFWLEVLSSYQCQSQLLWEKDIVQKMHQEIQGWIHVAAREQLEPIIRPTTSVPQVMVNDEPEPNFDNRNKQIAASIAAWLEFSADKAKVSPLESWDKEWDRTWQTEWEKNWKASWNSNRPRVSLYVDIDSMPQVPTANILSGHAAGRALIDISLVANAVKVPTQSLLVLETEAPAVFDGIPGPSDPHSQNTEYNWLGYWHSIHHPDLKQPGKWLPAWEAARNLAWALAWEHLENQPGSPVIKPTSSSLRKPSKMERPKLRIGRGTSWSLMPVKDESALESPQASSLHSRGSSENILQLAETQFQKLAAEARELFKLERSNQDRPETVTLFKGVDRNNIQELSEAAWREVSGEGSQAADELNPEVRKYMQGRAKKVLEDINKTLCSETPSEDTWRDVYTTTWKMTWQTSWEHAWIKVMRDTSNGFDKLGCKTNIRHQGQSLVSGIDSFRSYGRLREYLSGGLSKEDNHWRIRSAFKALNLLQNALLHSVPTCYREAMTISYFRDRPFEFTTPNPSTGLKRLAQVIQQDREEKIDHKSLQSQITSKLPEKYNAAKMMEEIWSTAIHADSNPDFMKGQDSECDRLKGRTTNNERPSLKYNMGRITWARHQWHKAVDDLRRGVARRRVSTDNYVASAIPRR
ncbi:unnamed protein product [Rhizoctonia solani]|uniref:Uncharacterized protein n=1 Tax=Rhizoctonia solani TaxID=456999 RepID=A0A8H2WY94_9AGAM|nr:unnamed protein product [Rhizoctonia solani]